MAKYIVLDGPVTIDDDGIRRVSLKLYKQFYIETTILLRDEVVQSQSTHLIRYSYAQTSANKIRKEYEALGFKEVKHVRTHRRIK